MEFLYLLEKIRNPVFDFFFSAITHLGEETLFLAIAIIFFWCVNKREGYYILSVGLIGTIINQAAKLIFKIPRPWVKDPDFTIVESAREEATGYSFPSGHTQNVAGTLGSVGRFTPKRWVRIVTVTLIILVALSRMYLGVHTPLDVGVSLLLGAALVFGFYPMFKTEERFKRFMPYIAGVCFLMSVGLVLYVFLLDPTGVDEANLMSAKENSSTLLGCGIGMIAVYFTDSKYINFETEARWYAQIIKLVIGLGVVIGIKAGLKMPLEWIFSNEYVARGVRYFIIVVFAGILWPLTFKYFKNLRINCLENLFKGKDKTNS